MKRILILALMVLSVLSAWAFDFSAVNVDGVEIWYNVLSSSKCEVAKSPSLDYKNAVRIPAAVTYSGKELSVTSIGEGAFFYCNSLTSVEIPNSVTNIGDHAFSDCKSLTSVEIPNSVTSIGDYAFSYCSSLTSVEIPNSVTSIGDYAFAQCRSLTSVEIGNSVTSIGDYAFSSCYSLTSVEIPNSVTSIGNSAFSGCSSLTSVEIPNSVTSIGDYAFVGCNSLTSVEIPNSVTSIGDYAFRYCSSLTSVEIPNSVTSIGNSAFMDCSSLTEVKVLAENPPTIRDNTFANITQSFGTLYIPTGTLAKYLAATGWKDFENIVEFDPQSGEIQEPTQCAEPEVSYADGELIFTCSTPGAAYHYSLTDTDIKDTKVYSEGRVTLSATYVIKVTASADGYTDSDEVTYTLCWYNVEPGDDAILTPSLQPAIVTMRGGEVIVEGADGLREVAFYGLDGACLGVVPVVDGRAQIQTEREVVIVRIGDRAVKVVR